MCKNDFFLFLRKVDTYSDYLQANIESISKGSSLKCFARTKNNQPKYDYKADPASKTKVIGNQLCEGLVVGDKSVVQRCVIGPNVRIGSDCKIVNCVLMEGCEIGDKCKIQNCLLGKKGIINNGCTLKEVTIKDETVVKENSNVQKDMMV